jgi:hypothetical protein
VQVKLDKRFSHGLQMLVSYTYSKTEDDIVSTGLHPSLQIRLPGPGTGGSKVLDIPHILVASATYELPFGKSGSGLAKRLLEGWLVSAITIYHSGDPLDVRVSASQLNTGSPNWANETCDPMKGAPRTVQQWFNTSCFGDPAQFQFGNYKIGDARGPSVFNTDASAAKRFTIGKVSAEMRIDVFNVFNKAHFDRPGQGNTGATFGTAAFGTISTTRLTPREAQVGVRLLF